MKRQKKRPVHKAPAEDPYTPSWFMIEPDDAWPYHLFGADLRCAFCGCESHTTIIGELCPDRSVQSLTERP